jgi:hypothetical protein
VTVDGPDNFPATVGVSPLLGMGLWLRATGYWLLVTKGMEHKLRVRLHGRCQNAFGHVYDDI